MVSTVSMMRGSRHPGMGTWITVDFDGGHAVMYPIPEFAELGDGYRVEVAMRYQNPSIESAVDRLEVAGATVDRRGRPAIDAAAVAIVVVSLVAAIVLWNMAPGRSEWVGRTFRAVASAIFLLDLGLLVNYLRA